jgi:hypothetical protein
MLLTTAAPEGTAARWLVPLVSGNVSACRLEMTDPQPAEYVLAMEPSSQARASVHLWSPLLVDRLTSVCGRGRRDADESPRGFAASDFAGFDIDRSRARRATLACHRPEPLLAQRQRHAALRDATRIILHDAYVTGRGSALWVVIWSGTVSL